MKLLNWKKVCFSSLPATDSGGNLLISRVHLMKLACLFRFVGEKMKLVKKLDAEDHF